MAAMGKQFRFRSTLEENVDKQRRRDCAGLVTSLLALGGVKCLLAGGLTHLKEFGQRGRSQASSPRSSRGLGMFPRRGNHPPRGVYLSWKAHKTATGQFPPV